MRYVLGSLLAALLLLTSCSGVVDNSPHVDAKQAPVVVDHSTPDVAKEEGPHGPRGDEGSADIPGPLAPMPAPGLGSPAAAGPASSLGGSVSAADGPAGEGSPSDNISHSMLTAGSFDDALNLDIFSEYFSASGLAQTKINQLEQPQWKNMIPSAATQSYKKLDLAFVIDVTGSMADELLYLQKEIDQISSDVALLFPEIEQRYSLVVYRDEGDVFVSKKFDFDSDLTAFKLSLNEQQAIGGGDYPEAMHTALNDAANLGWGNEEDAKILFLVADAPPHDQFIQSSFDSVFALKDKGVAIYPVAASGVADMAESIMRTAALLTGGQYVFLTDDSGIGDTHSKPKIPCYHVEKLKDVMVRMITDKLNNKRSEPNPSTLIRTVGKPVNGICTDESTIQ